jgi:hypothetical protein
MGDAQKDVFRVNFERRIKLEFHGASVTTDAGLLAYRELDDAFGLTDQVGAAAFDDPRTGTNTPHTLTALLRQSVYSRLGGYEDTNDAERLRVDPRSWNCTHPLLPRISSEEATVRGGLPLNRPQATWSPPSGGMRR